MSTESLPPGFTRRASGSLRVQIRVKGYPPQVRNFPLFADTPLARKTQMADAQAWASETRRLMAAGGHLPSRVAERTPLGDVLRRYEAECLSGDGENRKIERYRLDLILKDPIAERPVAALSERDLAAFRDRLIRAGVDKKISSTLRKLQAEGAPKPRLDDVRNLIKLRDQAERESDPKKRRDLEGKISAIEMQEGITAPARTTIINVTQLISRSLAHARQTMDAIPKLESVKMPKASPGRERRLQEGEYERIVEGAAKIHPVFPLMIDFAIETTLRKARLLSFDLSNIRDLGSGVTAIVFPRETAVRNKKTGIVPVTSSIKDIIERSPKVRGTSSEKGLFGVSSSQLGAWWEQLLCQLEVDNLRWHDLRHEGTSRLFERGLSTAEVMSITGHSTQEMVDRYSHYNAILVHQKLEKGNDLDALARQIEFLATQFGRQEVIFKCCRFDKRRPAGRLLLA